MQLYGKDYTNQTERIRSGWLTSNPPPQGYIVQATIAAWRSRHGHKKEWEAISLQ
jgi:hypothetical protein